MEGSVTFITQDGVAQAITIIVHPAKGVMYFTGSWPNAAVWFNSSWLLIGPGKSATLTVRNNSSDKDSVLTDVHIDKAQWAKLSDAFRASFGQEPPVGQGCEVLRKGQSCSFVFKRPPHTWLIGRVVFVSQNGAETSLTINNAIW